jgi:tetratricopeptide (TPR) repeat protein
MTYLAEAHAIAETVQRPYERLAVSRAAGPLYLRQGDLSTALACLEPAWQLCQEANIPLLFPLLAAQLGYAYALAGRSAEGIRLLEQGVEQGYAMGTMGWQPLILVWLGEAYLLEDRIDDGSLHAARAYELSRQHKEHGYEAWACRLLGEVALARDLLERQQAETSYRQALVLAEELGMRPLVAHCHRGLGILYATTGRTEQARVELSAAIELYRAMDMTFWLPQAEVVLAPGKGR